MSIRLFSYKLTNDSGFAPNPFWGIMTLATCKPLIRKFKRVGDWITGFTSKKLCGDGIGKEKLIFLMQVTDRVSISEYFYHPNFKNKIPVLNQQQFVFQAGDNIYKPQDNEFIQIENRNHFEKDKKRDLSGEFVLASSKFYYLGSEALPIPEDVRPDIPAKQSAHGIQTHNIEIAFEFIKYVTNKFAIGVHSAPHKWPHNDLSWKQ